MNKTATPCRTNADRQKAAARYIETALASLRRANNELITPDGELAFAGMVRASLLELAGTADRLRQYAANGW